MISKTTSRIWTKAAMVAIKIISSKYPMSIIGRIGIQERANGPVKNLWTNQLMVPEKVITIKTAIPSPFAVFNFVEHAR